MDDDLDDGLRQEMLSQLSAGALHSANTLRLVHKEEDRDRGEIAMAAMDTINQFLAKQNILSEHHHFKVRSPVQ